MSPDPFAAGSPGVVEEPGETLECDVAIVGAGVGGATLAWALRESGARVLVLEKGGFLPHEWQNWSAEQVFDRGRYRNSDPWVGPDGDIAVPGNYHYVGGSSKLYGATMPRMRESDFGPVATRDGESPAWPIAYVDLEPYYTRAEALYWVHSDDTDPTDPWRSAPRPFPPLPHEPPIQAIAHRLRRQGLRPFSLPQAHDWRRGGRCVLCATCDSYPCLLDAKGDADVCAMRPALESPTVRLLTHADVRRVVTGADGREVDHLQVVHRGHPLTVTAGRVVLSAGAVNTAALMLRSRSAAHPAGLANGSDMVGRNYMAHPTTFVVGVLPTRANGIVFEKTLGVNDWYHAGPSTPYPLGNIQSVGKLQGWTINAQQPRIPRQILEWMTRRSVEFLAMTEDLPVADSRVTIDGSDRVHLDWRPTNLESHAELVRRTVRAVRRCGYPIVRTQRLPWFASSHQCGTATMGADPTRSVVDPTGRSHDVANLWISDASTFPASGAVNPALTIAANALRIADHGGILT